MPASPAEPGGPLRLLIGTAELDHELDVRALSVAGFVAITDDAVHCALGLVAACANRRLGAHVDCSALPTETGALIRVSSARRSRARAWTRGDAERTLSNKRMEQTIASVGGCASSLLRLQLIRETLDGRRGAMPKFRCRCGFVHSLSPIPDDGWVAVRDHDYEELVAAEVGAVQDQANRDASLNVVVRLTTRLYQCPDCGALAWFQDEDGRAKFFVPVDGQ